MSNSFLRLIEKAGLCDYHRYDTRSGRRGGIIASLADLVAHAAIAVQVQRMVPTIDLRIGYLRAAPEGDLTATGRVLIVSRKAGSKTVPLTIPKRCTFRA